MMKASLITCIVLTVTITIVQAEYRYYYGRPSYWSLSDKISRLEHTVRSLKTPVHVHVGGSQVQSGDDGNHVFLHLSLDGKQEMKDEYVYASCYVQPNSAAAKSTNVRGYVHLRQKPLSPLEIAINVNGFPGAALHGFHVHEVANYENGCNSFGGHYNPYGKNHGGPLDTERHVGDWGNIQADDSGEVKVLMTDKLASLFGSESIVGRGIVIHAGTDDLGRGGDAGSLKTGNAGRRLACCAIGWTNGGPW